MLTCTGFNLRGKQVTSLSANGIKTYANMGSWIVNSKLSLILLGNNFSEQTWIENLCRHSGESLCLLVNL